MRGISEDRLKQIAAMPASVFEAPASEIINYLISKECQELQEPWMTLDEFLKSGFVGKCWVYSEDIVLETEYDTNGFWYDFRYIDDNKITRVMPVRKPEPPK